MNKRNRAFDFLKVLLIFIVVLHHSGFLSGILRRGYMAVEFFFILSGYLLAKTQAAQPGMTGLQYLKKRLTALYPAYLLAYLCMAGLCLLLGKLNYSAPWGAALELALLQNVGLPGGGGVNYPLWYLSVLITAGTALFILLRRLPAKAMNVLCAAVIVIVYAAHIATGKIEHWDNVLLVFYPPFWRGMADLMIGVLLARFEGTALHRAMGKSAKNIEIAAFAVMMLCLFLPGPLDFVTLAAIIVLMAALTHPAPVLARPAKGRVFDYLLRHEYAIFLHHAMFIDLSRAIAFIAGVPWLVVPLLLLGLPLFAGGCDRLTGRLMRMIKKDARPHPPSS